MTSGGYDDIPMRDGPDVLGSEAVFEHVCQPCSDEKIKEAVGFCVDCAEWLCGECFHFHRKPKPSRDHVLKDMLEMKKSQLSFKAADKCSEKCNKHSGKRLKYYCPSHDFLGCSLCVIRGHKTCKVHHIPDVCETSDVKNEFQHVTKKLEEVAKDSNDTVSQIIKTEQLIQKSKTETVNACRSYIKKIKESLDVAGAALEETCEKTAEANIERLRNVAGRCKSVEKECLGMKTRLENLESTGQHCNTFVALKQSGASLKALETKQAEGKRLSTTTTYLFKPNVAVETTITGPDGIGSLIEEQSQGDGYNSSVKGNRPKQHLGKYTTSANVQGNRPKQHFARNKDFSKVKARHIADIPVKLSENITCRITGSVLLSPDKLVLLDFNNKEVKVVETKTKTIVSACNVGGKPWAICKASDNSVIVTNKRELMFLSFNKNANIMLEKTISVSGKCFGVAVMDDKMVVTYITPDKMEIMDTNGTVLKTITDSDILQKPQYVIISADKQFVYVSNFNANTVSCMKLDGTLIATYKDSELQRPEQADIDSSGMIYVGGWASNNMHLVTPDCNKLKVILDESDGLKNVNAVSYCEQTNMLYVGMFGDVIKVFQLSFA